MKKKTTLSVYLIALVGMVFLVAAGCSKSKDNPDPIPETVTDIDGNIYHTVTIGTQVWMVENLKTTRFNDGSPIPLVTDGAAWGDTTSTTPKYCWYSNDSVAFINPYGALYNWYAVNTGKLAPAGWHVPTQDETKTLVAFLGGDSLAGGKMKEAGTLHWAPPNTGATNSSGFTAVPGGTRWAWHGLFSFILTYAQLWTATESDLFPKFAINIGLGHKYIECSGSGALNRKEFGYSVRCVKN